MLRQAFGDAWRKVAVGVKVLSSRRKLCYQSQTWGVVTTSHFASARLAQEALRSRAKAEHKDPGSSLSSDLKGVA
jgi:hypothetical protein